MPVVPRPLLLVAASLLTAALPSAPGSAHAEAPLLARHRARVSLPVYDVATGEARTVPAVLDPAADVAEAGGGLRLTREGATWSCFGCDGLGPQERLVSERPVYSPDGARNLSVDDESFRALEEVRLLPRPWTTEVAAAALSELSYVDNEAVLEEVLGREGLRLMRAAGFRAERERPAEALHWFVAVDRSRGRSWLVVRGTAGLQDLQRSLKGRPAPNPWGPGTMHGDYLAGAQEILGAVRPLARQLAAQGTPLTATGHSLGGALATAVVVGLRAEGTAARALVLAPAPLGDPAFCAWAAELGGVTGYFLPGEEILELAAIDRVSSLGWVGARVELPPAGPTGGLRHFVINYLEATVEAGGLDGRAYREALPVCVHLKVPCFGSDAASEAWLPTCMFRHAACLERAARTPPAREAASERELVLGLLDLPEALRPFRLATLARRRSAAGYDVDPLLRELERLGFGGPLVASLR